MFGSKEIPLWLVLALQVLLDVHYVLLSDTSRPFTKLLGYVTQTADTIEEYLKFSRMDLKTWPKQNNDALRCIIGECKMWVLNDFIDLIRTDHYKDVHETNLGGDSVLFKRHPVLCGMLLFRFIILKHDLGLCVVLAWGGVPSILHLCNAVLLKGIVQPWEDIEALILTHSAERIFIGGRLQKSQDFIKRFVLANGLSPSMFAPNVRSHSRLAFSSKGPRQMMASSAIATIYREQYISRIQGQEGTRSEVTLSAIEKLLLKSAQPLEGDHQREGVHGSAEESQIALMGAKFQLGDSSDRRKNL